MQIDFCKNRMFYVHEMQSASERNPAMTNTYSFVVQVSEKDTVSQSADSPATDVAISSSHNGPLTSGTSKPFSQLGSILNL